MKKVLFTLTLLLVPAMIMAESFSTLWKKVTEARQKDLPKTEISLLNNIIAKATAEDNYGHLIKAQLEKYHACRLFNDEKVASTIEEIKQKEAETQNKALQAVYNCALGLIYQDLSQSNIDPDKLSRPYFQKAMANPDELARHKTTELQPAFTLGLDSRIFNNDLLHVIGMYARDYSTLSKYYNAHGNRPAACLMALKALQETRDEDTKVARKSRYLHSLDSLIEVYRDIPEAGELAIEHYNFISESTDTPAESLVNYINYALNQWGKWPRMNVLRNALLGLQQPEFNISIGDRMLLPDVERQIRINLIRNINELTVKVYKVNIGGDTKLEASSKKDYAQLRRYIQPVPVQTITRRYLGQPDWKECADSVSLKGMPIGVYLIEVSADNKAIEPQRELLRVSNLYVIHEKIDKETLRLVTVNATTGKAIPGVNLTITTEKDWRNKTAHVDHLVTGENGEVIYHTQQRYPNTIYPYTENDKACDNLPVNAAYFSNAIEPESDQIRLYTDRSIYRPGQTIHVAGMAWHNIPATLSTQVLAKESIKLTLLDANDKNVIEKTVNTDDYGTLSADFVLPQSGLTGSYTIKANFKGKGRVVVVRVEQFKRPKFKVEIDKYKKQYAPGDTITVTGTARSYAGVPVQGAKVVYTVKREQSWWWRRNGVRNEGTVVGDTVVTANDGTFKMKVPMVFPPQDDIDIPLFYQLVIRAKVTATDGETHEEELRLPLSNRNAVLTTNLPTKVQIDSLSQFSFTRKNAMGELIDGTITYRFNQEPEATAAANTPIVLSHKLTVGKHTLFATCEGDTIKQEVIVFSMDDKRPVFNTPDWYYVSATQFSDDGKPVWLQLGSSNEGTEIFYTAFANGKVIAQGSQHISNEVITRQLQYKEEYGDGLSIFTAWVWHGKLYKHSTFISRPVPNKKLTLQWKTFRDKLTPGQKEEWTLQVLAPNGKPAKAQLIATLYDKSLDAIYTNYWSQPHKFRFYPCNALWEGGSEGAIGLYGFESYKAFHVSDLIFSRFNADISTELSYAVMLYGNRAAYTAQPALMEKSVKIRGSASVQSKAFDVVETKATTGNLSNEASTEKQALNDAIRENLNETAYFAPALMSDEKGNFSIRFTLPESVTTWHFKGLAHDKELNNGMIEADVVAQKTVMVQPNIPRFIRQGDKVQITTLISNTSENAVNGTARLQFLSAEDNKEVLTLAQPFAVEAGKSTTASFVLDTKQLSHNARYGDLLIVRILANGKDFSDGEQHYLPILPDMERVTTTVPFTQHHQGTKNIELKGLFPPRSKDGSMTIEYTNHPAWLMLQALPTLANPSEDNALSLAAAIYSNAIGQQIIGSSKKIADVMRQWRQETGKENSLVSNLQKNEELKTLLLNETPWINDAARETEQKQQLAGYLNENTINYRLGDFTARLQKLQNSDGSFSWWPGMNGSPYMTLEVANILARLQNIVSLSGALTTLKANAFNYLDKQVTIEVKELKKAERKGEKHLQPSELACHYLYSCALAGRNATSDMNYLIDLLDKIPTQLSIYGKARSAVILAHYGKMKHARDYLQSMNEYSVMNDETGRHYETPKAAYSWRNYRIPTQVAAIEALKILSPSDTTTIEEMKRWLLAEKRTQSWDTPINTVDAVYAFLTNANGKMDMTKLSSGNNSVLKIDGKTLELSKATAGLGYIKATVPAADNKVLTIEKQSPGTSWGALYASSWQKLSDVKSSAAGLSVKRDIIPDHQGMLKTGDKVKVRITIKAERDFDFVQLQDKRAACMEPAEQLSGYRWGYYCAPQDNVTNYYFDKLSKGIHVIETSYYLDRTGDYTTGLCTIQCAYSPEYSGREMVKSLSVK